MTVTESVADADVGHNRWDRLGVWASVACAIHCLVAPFIFMALPSFSGIWAHPLSHALIALLVLPVAGTVLCRGYRIHRQNWVAALAVLGIVCIVAGVFLPFVGAESASAAEQEDTACRSCCPQIVEEEDGSTSVGWPPASVATILGSLFLVGCHLGNFGCCRRCRVCAGG